jgi:hypothetical protein
VALQADTSTESSELLLLSLEHVCASMQPAPGRRELLLSVADIQLDNQMFHKGGFDFPVVLMRQEPLDFSSLNLIDSQQLVDTLRSVALLNVSLSQVIGSCKIGTYYYHFAP